MTAILERFLPLLNYTFEPIFEPIKKEVWIKEKVFINLHSRPPAESQSMGQGVLGA